MFKLFKFLILILIFQLSISSGCTKAEDPQNYGKSHLLTPLMRDFISITAGVERESIIYNPKTNHVFVPDTPLNEPIDSVKVNLDYVLENNPEFFEQFRQNIK